MALAKTEGEPLSQGEQLALTKVSAALTFAHARESDKVRDLVKSIGQDACVSVAAAIVYNFVCRSPFKAKPNYVDCWEFANEYVQTYTHDTLVDDLLICFREARKTNPPNYNALTVADLWNYLRAHLERKAASWESEHAARKQAGNEAAMVELIGELGRKTMPQFAEKVAQLGIEKIKKLERNGVHVTPDGTKISGV